MGETSEVSLACGNALDMWPKSFFHHQGSSNSHTLTSEQIMSDLMEAPDNDVVFVTQPPGAASGTGMTTY